MLQPEMTEPSAASSAAPTLKFENAAQAFSRARRAAPTKSTPVSELTNDALQERDELAPHAARGLQDLGMIERLSVGTGGRVGHARETEDLDSHVTCHDRLRYRRHPD